MCMWAFRLIPPKLSGNRVEISGLLESSDYFAYSFFPSLKVLTVCGLEDGGRQFFYDICGRLVDHLEETGAMLVAVHLLQQDEGLVIKEAIEGSEGLFLLLGMIDHTQGRGLQESEVLSVDHSAVGLLEVGHGGTDTVHLGLHAVGQGRLLVGTKGDLNQCSGNASDLPQVDEGLQVIYLRRG